MDANEMLAAVRKTFEDVIVLLGEPDNPEHMATRIGEARALLFAVSEQLRDQSAEARVKELKDRCERLEGELVWHQTYVRPLNDPDNPRHISQVLQDLEYAESRLNTAHDERDAAEEEATRAENLAESLAEALEMALEEYIHYDSEGGCHCIHCGAAWKDPAQEHHARKCQFMRQMLANYKESRGRSSETVTSR